LLVGIYVYNYFTEVHLGEVNFGEIGYGLRRCHMQDIFRGRTTELRILEFAQHLSIWTSYCGATFAIQSKYPDSKTWEEIGGKAGTHEIDRDGTKEDLPFD
jgi:hypothetical protein